MDKLHFIFSKDRNVRQIAARVLRFLQADPSYASHVRVTLIEKKRAGGVRTYHDWNVSEPPDLLALATVIAHFINLYVDRRDGHLYCGAILEVPRMGPMSRLRRGPSKVRHASPT
jgi:hypothetical protein